MKVRYIKSATVVIEHGEKKVLCDPWLTDGIYHGSWFHWPPLKFSAADFQDIDYIYISHVHPDHCDVETLKDLPKNKPVIIHDFHEKFLLNTLKRLGFQNIVEVPNRGTYSLGPDFTIEILAGDDNDIGRFRLVYGSPNTPDVGKTRQIDSLAVFSGGGKTVVNSNDVPLSLIAGAIPYICQKYREIDMLLVSYAGAGPYPQAYDLPNDKKFDAAIKAAYSYLSGTMMYIRAFAPKYYLPYAGQYTLGGKFAPLNPYKGTFELDELISDLMPVMEMSTRSEMVLLDSGEWFDADNGQASKPFTPTDFLARKKYINDVLAKKAFDYEHLPVPTEDFLPRILNAQKSLQRKQDEYSYYNAMDLFIEVGHEHLYRVPLDGTPASLAQDASPDRAFIRATLDPRLLDKILSRKANWNNAEVGSHITLYDYVPASVQEKTRRSLEPMAHFLLAYLQEPRGAVASATDPSPMTAVATQAVTGAV